MEVLYITNIKRCDVNWNSNSRMKERAARSETHANYKDINIVGTESRLPLALLAYEMPNGEKVAIYNDSADDDLRCAVRVVRWKYACATCVASVLVIGLTRTAGLSNLEMDIVKTSRLLCEVKRYRQTTTSAAMRRARGLRVRFRNN